MPEVQLFSHLKTKLISLDLITTALVQRHSKRFDLVLDGMKIILVMKVQVTLTVESAWGEAVLAHGAPVTSSVAASRLPELTVKLDSSFT